MPELNWVAVIVAIVGAGGIGVAIREIASVFSLWRNGVSGKEDSRRKDIISQRDHALAMQEAAEAGERAADKRADAERDRRIAWQEHAARQRRLLIINGVEPGASPEIDDTENPTRNKETQ